MTPFNLCTDAPESKDARLAVIKARYAKEAEGEAEATPYAEQERWEAEQLARTRMGVGSKDRAQDGQQYDLLFDDQIEYVKVGRCKTCARLVT